MTTFRRIVLSTVLLAFTPFAIPFACGSKTVTETGNPPFVDQRRIEVVRSDEGIVVTGSAGSTPPGARVTLRNDDEAKGTSTTSNDDGSFSLSLDGDPDDEYELVVERDGEERTLALKGAEEAEDEPPVGGAGSEAACQDVFGALSNEIVSQLSNVDDTCSVDADCVLVTVGPLPCTGTCPNPTPASVTGAEEYARGHSTLLEFCDEADALECETPEQGPVYCFQASDFATSCVDGQCSAQMLDECSKAVAEGFTALEGFADGLERSCSVDDDCEIVNVSATCTPCGRYTAVNTEQGTTLDSEVSEFRQESCVGYEALGCSKDEGCPNLPPSDARCVFDPSDAVSPGSTESPVGRCEIVERDGSCAGLLASADEAVNAAVTDAQQGCLENSDCEIVSYPALSCMFDQGSCGQMQAIASAQSAALDQRLTTLDEEMCTPFSEAGCEPEPGACSPTVPFTTAACADGTCRLE